MVDFKKLRKQMLRDRGVPEAEIERKLQKHDRRRIPEQISRVSIAAIHAEINDPAYFDALMDYADGHWPA